MNLFPYLGHGIGLRTEHYQAVLEQPPVVDWFEVISDNFLVAGGNPRRVLREVRGRSPVVMHGVSLSLGSVDPINADYLNGLAELAAEVQPELVSDHLCWGSLGGHYAHDLLPLPYTEEALRHVAERVQRVQDRLKRRILVENVSTYVSFCQSAMTEWEFLAALCQRADCGVLLDVNNIFVSAHNHSFDPAAFIAGIPLGRVGQIHLAGHSTSGELLLDTHDHPVCDGVWDLYRLALQRFGRVSTLIEWDDHIPPLERLVEESRHAAVIETALLAAPIEAALLTSPAVKHAAR
ncbi:MAG TPA: DUF692 domain-containing protein [Polyangia bacterium]|jgi:hypothetical protein